LPEEKAIMGNSKGEGRGAQRVGGKKCHKAGCPGQRRMKMGRGVGVGDS